MTTELENAFIGLAVKRRDQILSDMRSTEPFDTTKVTDNFDAYYKTIFDMNHAPVVFVDGPTELRESLASHEDTGLAALQADVSLEPYSEIPFSPLIESLWDKLAYGLGNQIHRNLAANLHFHFWDESRGETTGVVTGGMHVPTLAFYQMLAPIPGIELDHRLLEQTRILLEVNLNHVWAAFENVCFVTRKHTVLHLNHRGELHNPDGPAWALADGTEIHAVNGRIQTAAR